MISWILPAAATALYFMLRDRGHAEHHEVDDLPERHRGHAAPVEDPPAAPLQPNAVAVMLYPWHLRPHQTESRTGSRPYPAQTRVELLARGELTRHGARIHQVRVIRDGRIGWAYVLPSELAAGEASPQTPRPPPEFVPPDEYRRAPLQPAVEHPQPGVTITRHPEPAPGQWGARGAPGDPHAPAAAPAAPALPPLTRELVSATERAYVALGADAALHGSPSAPAVRAAQAATSYPAGDGAWSAPFRRYLARGLGPNAARVYPPRDARHRAARDLAAYALLANDPNAQSPSIAMRQPQLGVAPSGLIDIPTALAMARELRG